jgi:hypothetical protein
MRTQDRSVQPYICALERGVSFSSICTHIERQPLVSYSSFLLDLLLAEAEGSILELEGGNGDGEDVGMGEEEGVAQETGVGNHEQQGTPPSGGGRCATAIPDLIAILLLRFILPVFL